MGYLRKDGKDLTRVTVVPERSTEPNEPGDIFDPVTHPAHYCEGRTYEPKDVIMDWGVDFYIGNAIKYLSRSGRKGSAIEDLQKAQQYIQFEIDYLKKHNA